MSESQTDNTMSKILDFGTALNNALPSDPKSLHRSPLYLAVQSKLIRSQLHHQISPLDIFYEVWSRGVVAIGRGHTIRQPVNWSYVVAMRVIAEKIPQPGRRTIPTVPFDKVEERIPSQCSHYDEAPVDDVRALQYQQVRQAFKQLKSQDRELLELSIVENMPYKDIAEQLAQRDQRQRTSAALRQRKRRALERLRELYRRSES